MQTFKGIDIQWHKEDNVGCGNGIKLSLKAKRSEGLMTTPDQPPRVTQRNLCSRNILLAALAAIALEVCVGILSPFMHPYSPDLPWTFHTLWGIGVLVLIGYYVKQCGAIDFVILVMLGALVSCFFWIAMPWSVCDLLGPRYVGVEPLNFGDRPTEDEELITQRDDPIYDDDCLLFQEADRHVQARTRCGNFFGRGFYVEHHRAQGFLFWQTGLATGFDPRRLPEYCGKKGILGRTELILTVGPMVIVEATIWGLLQHFPVFLSVVCIWSFVKRIRPRRPENDPIE